jgi:hypothetical protein
LEESQASGEKDKDDAEDDILDEAALGARDFKTDQCRRHTHKCTSSCFFGRSRVLLGRYLRERVINRDYKL